MTDPPPEHACKRAIVSLCWGEAFVGDAIESARSAASIEADRVLITDAAGAEQASSCTAFAAIIPVELAYRSNLEKSRLIDVLPTGYDTFLCLDADTRVIGDVSLAFDKAERHGIAVVPAPNYNLEEYFGFGEVMAQTGAASADRMMYNAGVIFLHLTPAVRQVLERWRDLCADLGVKFDCQHDQPFLTLAFEQLEFTPYVLSPAYNYRGLGEYAVGQVRIWHSHFGPPADLNLFETAWPGRRFWDGKRVLIARDPVGPKPMPLPQGMARLMLTEFRSGRRLGTTEAVIAEALAVQREQGSRAANRVLLRHIGIDPLADRDEAYYSEALHFLLGQLHAHAGEPEKMASRLSLSRTMPAGEDDLLYSDHVNQSKALEAARMRAIERGLPSILIACMPRSASATLTHSVARALQMPVLRLSAGWFPAYFLVPSWLDMFLEGGAITQDHFAANDFNVGVLTARGSRDLFVLVRDPRAAPARRSSIWGAIRTSARGCNRARVRRQFHPMATRLGRLRP